MWEYYESIDRNGFWGTQLNSGAAKKFLQFVINNKITLLYEMHFKKLENLPFVWY